MTDKFFAVYWCPLSFYYSILNSDGVTGLFFLREHCTLPTTLEMGKITNPLNHCTFLRINLQINVPLKTLKKAFLKP